MLPDIDIAWGRGEFMHRVPFYWRYARAVQRMYAVDGIPLGVGTLIFAVFSIPLSIDLALDGYLFAQIILLFAIGWLVFVLGMTAYLLTRNKMDYEHARDAKVNKFRALDAKDRKELKPLAKYVAENTLSYEDRKAYNDLIERRYARRAEAVTDGVPARIRSILDMNDAEAKGQDVVDQINQGLGVDKSMLTR